MSPDDTLCIIVGAAFVGALVCLVIWGVLRGAQVAHDREVADMLATHDKAQARRALVRQHRPDAW